MSIGPVPAQSPVVEQPSRLLTSPWRSWFSQLFFFGKALGAADTTAMRPDKDLYVGQMYFDTDLGIPVFIQSLGPPVVWVDATGAPV
jgi:hypothetical protein